MTTQTTDCVFAGLTAENPLADLSTAAYLAAARSAESDMRRTHLLDVLTTDRGTVAFLRDPETRSALESWLGAYGHDEALLAALTDDARAEVLASAWLAYGTAWMQGRDAAREASR